MLPRELIGKFIRRALWMNDPLSLEFRMFFMEMITEIRNLSGRSFNADITLNDLKRTITSITEKYPSLKKISLNTVIKAMNTMDSLSRAGDLFSIASAVSASWLSVGTLFLGPLPYVLLKVFAPGRLKCGVVMGVGGLIGLELYNVKEVPPALSARSVPPFTVLAGVSAAFFLLAASLPFNAPVILKITGFLVSFILFIVFLSGLVLDRTRPKNADKPSEDSPFLLEAPADGSIFSQFRLDDEEARLLFSLYYALSDENIESTSDPRIKANKRIWVDKWKRGIEGSINGKIVTSPVLMKKALTGPVKSMSKFKKALILLECSLFQPFYPLNDLADIVIPPRENTIPLKRLAALAEDFGAEIAPGNFRTVYRDSMRALNSLNVINQIVRGLSSTSFYPDAPFAVVRTGINRSGMVSLASLIIGGGAFLDSETFPLLAGIAENNSYAVLAQAARLETVCRTVLKDLPDFAQNLESVIRYVVEFRGVLVKSFNEKEADREELRDSIHFVEMSIKRIMEILRKK
jgi:hypothetical protein